MDELEPYDLRDPAGLIREVAERVTLVEDTAWLALVHRPSSDQRLVRVDPLPVPALLDDDDDISEHLRAAAEGLGIGWSRMGRGPEHMAVTIVVRPGYAVLGPNEGVWCRGWRYSNHCQSLYTGELVLVTEHGWVDFMTDAAGLEPRMVTTPG
jgi:hypothetical protein